MMCKCGPLLMMATPVRTHELMLALDMFKGNLFREQNRRWCLVLSCLALSSFLSP